MDLSVYLSLMKVTSTWDIRKVVEQENKARHKKGEFCGRPLQWQLLPKRKNSINFTLSLHETLTFLKYLTLPKHVTFVRDSWEKLVVA